MNVGMEQSTKTSIRMDIYMACSRLPMKTDIPNVSITNTMSGVIELKGKKRQLTKIMN